MAINGIVVLQVQVAILVTVHPVLQVRLQTVQQD